MRAKKAEYTIIKLSVIVACLIISVGLAQRYVGPNLGNGKTAVPPVTSIGQGATTSQGTVSSGSTSGQASTPGTVVAIGDSYTYGYPYGPDSSWVKAAGQSLGAEFINKGKTSQSSADLLARFQQDVLSLSPQKVIILVGTGDALRGVPLNTYQNNVEQMVTEAKAKNIVPILGLPLPYPDVNARQLVPAYRIWLTSYAGSQNLKVIDFNPVVLDDNGNWLKADSDDGKYPNKAGYQAMAQAVTQALR